MSLQSSLAFETSIPQGGERGQLLERLRVLSYSGLRRMFVPRDRLFVFRLRLTPKGLVAEGLSRRYTAIALIGLAGDDTASLVLEPHSPVNVCSRLIDDLPSATNLGDVALVLWAALAVGHQGVPAALSRLRELDPLARHPTVEVAWALAALCVAADTPDAKLRDQLAERLIRACSPSGIFPHVLGPIRHGPRSHVACFADLVYPVYALARYARQTGSIRAREIAAAVASRMCELQGLDGQWWWHYDVRTGRVLEGYPVYAVHQDSMAPLALLEAEEVSGVRTLRSVMRGLDWLASCRELGGGSLIDSRHDIIWRKVARREPNKLSRHLQAVASSLHKALRVPGLDATFRPNRIDFEDRPYHLGWVLYVWNHSRVKRAAAHVRDLER